MKKRFTTTLDEELIKQLKILAVKKNTTAAHLLEEAIKQMVKKND
ncbi:hypothetical protein OQI87_01055 [Lactobacillus kefiranofaciens]|nr:hypothetical protein [Lactobacillus kefiranofaciens]MDH5099763.1 hypothetical protein [Lactobacillus kefiranofaciens]